MNEQNIIYSIKDNKLKRIENYLGKRSHEYGFSAKKREENSIYFIDNSRKIFAILNPDKKEVELSLDVSQRVIDGIEKIIGFGGRS